LTFYPIYFLGSPTKDRCTEGSDTKTILSRGLAVVDCSWNQLDKTAFHRAKVFFNFFGIFIRSFDFPGSLGMLFTWILCRFFPGTKPKRCFFNNRTFYSTFSALRSINRSQSLKMLIL